jgi:hypothetical protein
LPSRVILQVSLIQPNIPIQNLGIDQLLFPVSVRQRDTGRLNELPVCPIALVDCGAPDVLMNLEGGVLTSARVNISENGRIAGQLEMLFRQFQRVLEPVPVLLVTLNNSAFVIIFRFFE